MRNTTFISFAAVVLILVSGVAAQPQRGGRGGPPGRGGRGGPPGRGPGPGGTERLIDELSLSSMQQGLDAHAALAAYDQTVREQTIQARQTLLAKMKTILADDQFSRFKEDLDQIPLVTPPPQQPRGVATSDLVDRLMGFDTNHDGMVSKDELPERMLNLLDQGDTNNDAALDREEMRRLSEQNSVNNQPPPGRGGRGRRGGPPPL